MEAHDPAVATRSRISPVELAATLRVLNLLEEHGVLSHVQCDVWRWKMLRFVEGIDGP